MLWTAFADVELEEIDKYSALVFSPAAGDGQQAEGTRQAVAALGASLAGTRSMLKVVIPDFDQVRWSHERNPLRSRCESLRTVVLLFCMLSVWTKGDGAA